MAAGRSGWLGALAVLVGAVGYFLAFVPYGFYLEDEGTVLYQIARTYHGQLPYVDFHTGYTPGLFYGNAFLFRIFGENVIALRTVLALVNALSALLLFVISRRVASVAWALAGTVVYVAFLPFFGGEFASFNIPYPSWYVTLGWLTSLWWLLRYEETGNRAALVSAGLGAGVCFAFKPNSGVFAAAAAGFGLFVLGTAGGSTGLRRLTAFGLATFGISIGLLFGFYLVSFEILVFVLPWLALAILVARRRLGARGPAGRAPLTETGLFALGFVLPNLPWLAYFLYQMPLREFLREVLLVGGAVQQVYWIPYPLPDWWALALVVAVVAAGGALVGVRRDMVAPRTVVAAALALGLVGAVVFELFARMPEGMAVSVVWQLENAAFFIVPLTLGAALWWVARAFERPQAPPRLRPMVLLTLSALASLEQLNPRLDFMHLVMGVPAMVPVAAFVGSRFTRSLRGLGRAGATLAVVLVTVPFVVAGVRLAGNLQCILRMDRVGGSALLGGGGLAAVPVGVEASVGQDLAALGHVVRFVREHTSPGEPVFGFPALAAVNFLAGRESPVRHDYFFPGRPAHVDEAQVVATLAAVSPRYVLTLNDRFGFFNEAPAYYFILRDWVRSHYVLALKIGRYDVLQRRDLPFPVESDVPAARSERLPADLRRATEAGPMPVRLEAIDAIGRQGGPEDVRPLLLALQQVHRSLRARVTAAVLAIAERSGGLLVLVDRVHPPEREELLFMRTLGDFGDVRALDYLTTRFADPPSLRMRSESGRALAYAVTRVMSEPYVLVGSPPPPPVLHLALPAGTLEGWLVDRKLRERVGAWASMALGLSGRRDAIPLLHAMVAEKRYGWVRIAAARALMYLDAPGQACMLVRLLGSKDLVVQNLAPSFLLDVAARSPKRARACLVRGLRRGNGRIRENGAWVAGVLHDRALVDALVEVSERRGEPAELAALWALGEIGDARATAAVAAALRSSDPEVRAFAAEAERKLDAAALAATRAAG